MADEDAEIPGAVAGGVTTPPVQVIIRSHGGAALLSALDTVVAYEADSVSGDDHIGWSVIVTGVARRVEPGAVTDRYRGLADPWAGDGAGDGAGYVVGIRPEPVTGFGLVEENASPSHR